MLAPRDRRDIGADIPPSPGPLQMTIAS